MAQVIVAQWKAEIEAARTGSSEPIVDLQTLLRYRQEYREASGEERDTLTMVLPEVSEGLAKNANVDKSKIENIITDKTSPIAEYIEEWVFSLNNEKKTLDMKRSDVRRFAEQFKVTTAVQPKTVKRWAHDLSEVDGLKPTTVRRILSACRGYWQHLQFKDLVDDTIDPFKGASPAKSKSRKEGPMNKRKEFTPSEVVRLHRAATDDQDHRLADLIWLGMWTGCRIEELCSLTVANTHDDRMIIADSKTEAGKREVPMHSALKPTVERLKRSSSDGRLISGLKPNKYGDYSNAVGKRFGRLQKRLGFGQDFVFHSIRKTVATSLENADVPENVSADILGHEKKTMTYGLYSGGTKFARKAAAIEKIAYPESSAN